MHFFSTFLSIEAMAEIFDVTKFTKHYLALYQLNQVRKKTAYIIVVSAVFASLTHDWAAKFFVCRLKSTHWHLNSRYLNTGIHPERIFHIIHSFQFIPFESTERKIQIYVLLYICVFVRMYTCWDKTHISTHQSHKYRKHSDLWPLRTCSLLMPLFAVSSYP